jgi:hypothetical protein
VREVTARRIIFTLTSLFSLAFQGQGAASPVPRQLYGKSIVINLWTTN